MKLHFGDPVRPVTVSVDSPELAEAVRGLFRPRVVAAEEVVEDGDGPLVVVRAGAGGFRIETSASGGARRVETLPTLLAELETEILRGLLAREEEATHLHAAGAVGRDGAMLALGGSGAGKSNVALAWAREGHPLLGDDAVLMDPDGRVRAVPRLLKLERARLPDLDLEPEDTVAFDPDDPEVWIDPSGTAPWADAPAPVRLVAGIRYDPSSETRVERLERVDGLRLLLDGVLSSGASRAESLDRFIRATGDAVVLDVRFRSAAEAARRMSEVALA